MYFHINTGCNWIETYQRGFSILRFFKYTDSKNYKYLKVIRVL